MNTTTKIVTPVFTDVLSARKRIDLTLRLHRCIPTRLSTR